jgi:transcription antitermination protein NusB
MPTRRKSRQKALQVLFTWDLIKLPIDQAINTFYDELAGAEQEEETDEQPPPAVRDAFLDALARGTAEHVETLDRLISQRAERWRLERMPVVDRNILRMAIYEMKYEGTPPPVVIDEALELAKRYSEEEAVPFLNGVLDAVRRIIAGEVSLPDTESRKDPVEDVVGGSGARDGVDGT